MNSKRALGTNSKTISVATVTLLVALAAVAAGARRVTATGPTAAAASPGN